MVIAEAGDYRAMATDGPVSKTWEELDDAELHRFFRAAYSLAQDVIQESQHEQIDLSKYTIRKNRA